MESARTWLPRGLALAGFGFYVLAIPAQLAASAEAGLARAALALEVASAPGAPLYCIAAQVMTLVPIGSLGFRLGLLSAACAALAVLWTVRLVIALSPEDDLHATAGGMVAGALLGLSPVLLGHAVVPALHAPAAALLAGGLLLLAKVARGGDARSGLALAALCGLGLGLHTGLGLFVVPVLVLLGVRLYRGARWPRLAPLVVVGLAAVLYAYVPVRAGTPPASLSPTLNIPPDRIDRVGAYLVAAEAFADTATPQTPSALGASEVVESLVDQLGPLTPLAALFGLAYMLRLRRGQWLAAALLVLGAGDLGYALWRDPALVAEWPARLSLWPGGVPLALGTCVCVGVGVATVSRKLGLAGPFAAAVIGVMLVLPVALVWLPAFW